jgi:hypothetical protein
LIKINPPVIAGDEGKEKDTIRRRFMEELCRRDDEVNRGKGSGSNVFTIEEIWKPVLSNSFFNLDYVKKFIREFDMEEDPDIEVFNNEKVKLTEKGRTRCTDPDV